MKCMFCGKENYNGATFCRFCGKKNFNAAVKAQSSHKNDSPAYRCPFCGKENSGSAKFCKYCGSKTTTETKQNPKAASYNSGSAPMNCSYCGRELPDSVKFCIQCGAEVPDEMTRTPNTQINSPQLKNHVSDYTKSSSKVKSQTSVDPLLQQPFIQTGMQIPEYGNAGVAAAKKRLSAGKVIFTMLIIVVIVFIVLKTADYFDNGNGGSTNINNISDDMLSISNIAFEPSDYDIQGEQAEVSKSNKIASVNGVTVDLSGVRLEEQQILEIKKLPQKYDDSNGMTVNAYDITLSEISEFGPYVIVSFPLTAKENEHSFIQYYNENTRSWELIPSDTDRENGTITFATNHFTTFAEFVQINGPDFLDKTSAFEYVGGYENPLSKIYLSEEKLNAKLNEMDPSTVESLLKNGEFPSSDATTATLSIINDLTNTAGTPGDAAGLSKLFSQSTATKLGPCFIAIGATATLTRCVYQWQKGDSAWSIVKDNAVNLAELGLTAAGLAYSSPILLAGATGIWAAGVIYENYPIAEHSSIVEKAYHQFNIEHMCFVTELGVFLPYGEYYTGGSEEKYFIHTTADGKFNYEEIFHDLELTYLTKQKAPKRLAEIIVNMVDTYCDSFWQIDVKKRDMYIESINNKESPIPILPYTSLYDENWGYNSMKISAYKENMKNTMISEMQPYLEKTIYKLIYQMRKDLIDRIRSQLEPWLNQTITVEISDSSLKNGETFDRSTMAAYDIRFIYNSMTSITDYENWNFSISDRSDKVFEMTLFNYIKAGCPHSIGFYEKGKTEPVLTAVFEFTEPVITIILDKQDYSGIYTGTSYGEPLNGGEAFELRYNAVRIEEKETGLLVGPCLENGNYESELQVFCTYNTEVQRYEGTVLLEEGSQWTELIFSVSINGNGGTPKADVIYIQHFSGRQSMGYKYDVTWTSSLAGTAITRQQSGAAETPAPAPEPGGQPVGGFGF
ncbi:MAG: zinc ribbon domain-containing protein [Eubacteriales bacterium]